MFILLTYIIALDNFKVGFRLMKNFEYIICDNKVIETKGAQQVH